MLNAVLLIILALCTTIISAEIYFVNPPRFGSEGDFSSNAVYTIGQNLRVQWSEAPENVGISVLLYQLDATDGAYKLPGQYLFRMNFPLVVGSFLHYRIPCTNVFMADICVSENVVNSTIYDWTVAVSENLPATLQESNLFYLSIFQEGKTSSDSNSHYFNITEGKSTASSASSSTITPSASTALSTSTQMASSIFPASTSSVSTVPESTTTQPSSSSDAGMSTGAKIGIGAGIPAAAIIGIGAGWFFFGRRRRQPVKGPSIATDPRESAASTHPDHRTGGTSVSEYWGPGNYQYETLLQSKQPPPPSEHFSPQIFEASGESRATEPAELYTEPPNPREHPGHRPDSMRSY